MDLRGVSTQSSTLVGYVAPCRVDAEEDSCCNPWVINSRRGGDDACFGPLPIDMVLEQQNVRFRRAEDDAARTPAPFAMPPATPLARRDHETDAPAVPIHVRIASGPSPIQAAAREAYMPRVPASPGNLIDLVV